MDLWLGIARWPPSKRSPTLRWSSARCLVRISRNTRCGDPSIGVDEADFSGRGTHVAFLSRRFLAKVVTSRDRVRFTLFMQNPSQPGLGSHHGFPFIDAIGVFLCHPRLCRRRQIARRDFHATKIFSFRAYTYIYECICINDCIESKIKSEGECNIYVCWRMNFPFFPNYLSISNYGA